MLLSICIPTKNRAAVLQKSLQSIVSQNIFTERDDIEIVVCDNASDDYTAAAVQEFADHFKGNIRYHRNDIDIEDANVEQVLRHGKGEFLKLANDSLNWLPGSLEKMVRLVEMTLPLKPVLFFLNQSRPTEEPITEVSDIDALLRIVSYHITWIGGFGVWKNHLNELPNFGRHAELKLPQVDALLQQMSISKNAYIFNLPIFHVLPTGPKGGYNIAEVFGTNYLAILRQFNNQISDATMSVLKKEVLEKHILPFYCSAAHNFGQIDIEKHLPDYVQEPYFEDMLANAKALKGKEEREKFQKNAPRIWRQRNQHNQTVIRNLFDFDKVSVGQATYGPLNIQEWGHPDEQLSIGHYVSISEGVTFLLGGNHPHQGITTFPVKVKFLGHAKEAQTKGAITVGDDVWLGHNAMVMSGVKIAQGAVVAAGAVVSRDVPPYAIVAGNPARVVKYRFSDSIIQQLLRINYAFITPEQLAELGLDLYETSETEGFSDALNHLIQLSQNAYCTSDEKNKNIGINQSYHHYADFNKKNNKDLNYEKPIKIFFIGNSITLHSPSESIGWHKNNGMAASTTSNDYVNILLKNLKIKHGNCLIKNFSELENKPIEDMTTGKNLMALFKTKKPEITIFQLGDNVASDKQLVILKNNLFHLTSSAKEVNSRVFILSTWWESKEKDEALLSVCQKFNSNYIYIGDIFNSTENTDRSIKEYSHSGVDNHPRDWGMNKIADRLYAAINSLEQK